MEKKEMIYTGDFKPEILYTDIYKGYTYYVVSYGTHPCGYVEIPEGHPYYNVHYDNLDIRCHGGLTFNDKLAFEGIAYGKYCIGWDYAHVGDYVYYGDKVSFNFMEHFRECDKYTTDEIIDDCKYVIDQIIDNLDESCQKTN